MATVVLENLVKTYPASEQGPANTVVHGINLEINSGEFMVLVGPSGCGKSTTLRMIAGLEEISSGAVHIDGKRVNEVHPKDRDIAMVFQNYALYPHMSVYDNMAFGLKMRGFPKAEIESRVREAAEMLGLSELLARKPKALSGGQRQRVAVGRAIVRKPKVFLFDEPLSNLDAKMRVSTRSEISRLHARLGATMIYVTHDQVEAMTMGDRICVMHEGRIRQVAAPLDLYQKPADLFVAGFIGSPPMNFFRGRLERKDGERLWLVGENKPDACDAHLPLPTALSNRIAGLDGRQVVLGLRPEHVRESSDAEASREGALLEAEIDLAEPMGSETLLYLSSPAGRFIARVKPSHRHVTGHRIQLCLDLAHATLFDNNTGTPID